MTDRELTAWLKAQPPGPRTCADCGRVDDSAFVHPQHPKFYPNDPNPPGALCGKCLTARNAQARERRKAQLAAEPRCACNGCKARGNYRTVGGLLLCGRHMRKARAEAARRIPAGMEWMALAGGAMQHTREDVLAMAEGRAEA